MKISKYRKTLNTLKAMVKAEVFLYTVENSVLRLFLMLPLRTSPLNGDRILEKKRKLHSLRLSPHHDYSNFLITPLDA